METAIKNGTNYSMGHFGELKGLGQYLYKPKNIPGEFPGKLFLKQQLNLTGMEVSVNSMPPGSSIPFYHKHKQNEELFICIKGNGEFIIDEDRFPIKEGTMIRIDPSAERVWRNCSEEDLVFIVVQSEVDSCSSEFGNDGFGVQKDVNW